MPRRPNALPNLLQHRSTSRAYDVLPGERQRHYVGTWPQGADRASAEAEERHAREIAEWKASGGGAVERAEISVSDLVDRFFEGYVQAEKQWHCGPETGKKTSSYLDYRSATRHLKRLYGTTVIDDFGPLALRAVRDR